MKPIRIHKNVRDASEHLKKSVSWLKSGSLMENETKSEGEHLASIHDFIVLDKVRQNLSEKYPPDWLEKHGVKIYGATLAGCGMIYLIIAFVWAPWWNLLIPIIVPPLFITLLPKVFWGREPARPRWAHPRAVVEWRDVEQVNRIVRSMPLDQRTAIMEYCPANTGDRFFEIWKYVQGHRT
jgi:hypothetical protein